MRPCNNCGCHVPNKMIVDGKPRNLQNRKFCLECSPFGGRNTRRDISTPKVLKTRKTTALAVTRYRQRLKQKLIDHKGGRCQRCGYDKPVARVYEFHHRDPAMKEFGISGYLSRSWQTLVTEVEKCDILCRNCHAEVHDEIDKKGG